MFSGPSFFSRTVLGSLILLLVSLAAFSQQKKVAILVFPGVQIIDYTGPYETFGQAGYRVFTVGADTNTLLTSMSMKMVPTYDFNTAPQADILVIPGGAISHQLGSDDPIVQWIKKQYDQSKWVLAVCNGTFVFGATGLLDGKKATTNSGMVDHLSMAGNNITPVLYERFVQDGKIITTGGLSAGIDGALHIISGMDSEGRAREIANQMEYDWDPKRGYARGKLADMILSDIMDFNPPLRNKTVIQYKGNEHHWISEFLIRRNESSTSFYQQIIRMTQMAAPAVWQKKEEQIQQNSIHSAWEVTDMFKQKWRCKIEVGNRSEQIHVLFQIDKIQ